MMPSDRLHYFLAKWEREDSINEITTNPHYLKFYISLTWVLCSKLAKSVNHRFGRILQDQVLRVAINRWIGKAYQDSLNYYWDVINKKLYGLSCWLNLLPKWTCYNQFTFVTLNISKSPKKPRNFLNCMCSSALQEPITAVIGEERGTLNLKHATSRPYDARKQFILTFILMANPEPPSSLTCLWTVIESQSESMYRVAY